MTLRIHFRVPDRSVKIEAKPETASEGTARTKLVRHLRIAAYVRQKNRCYWCGKTNLRQGQPGEWHPNIMTAEHLVRRADGGQDTPENVVAACARCNNDRDRRPDGVPRVRVKAISRPHVVCEATG